MNPTHGSQAMAIHRGIQSALFYYLSCAPCADVRYRKRRKQEAALSRAERLALDAEESNVYRHPGEPSSTNPHWQSEIELGPTFVRKGKKKASTGDSQRQLKVERANSNASHNATLPDFDPRSCSSATADRRWRSRSDGRGDEPWCGSSSLLQRPATARTNGSTATMYHTNYNPAINEMHPPTVTKVNRREDVIWMMQPVPISNVMGGSERGIRGRSDSGGGSRLRLSSTGLSTQVSTRLLEPRSRTGTPSVSGVSRESSFRSVAGPSEQRREKSGEHDFASMPPHSTDGSNESARSTLRIPELAAMRHPPRRATSRPQLSTVLSDGDLPSQMQRSTPKENSMPTSLPGVNGIIDILDGQAVRSARAGREKPVGAVFRHKHDDSEVSIRPELFDSWYTPDFELGKYIFEHTKREVHKRWSMDL